MDYACVIFRFEFTSHFLAAAPAGEFSVLVKGNEEIATELGISENTVRNQVSKALRFLKDGVGRIYSFFLSFFA